MNVAKSAERTSGSYPTTFAGVFSFGAIFSEERQPLFEITAIDEVWGIGPRVSAKLMAGGIHAIADLLTVDIATLRRQHSVALERTIRELQGVRTLDVEDVAAPRQQIISLRPFGHAV